MIISAVSVRRPLFVSTFTLLHFSPKIYTVGTLLSAMVRTGDLPGLIQRVSAYYIVYDLFKGDGHQQHDGTFLSFLLAIVDTKEPVTSKVQLIERNFVAALLQSGTKEFGKQQTSSVLQQHDLQQPFMCDLAALKMQYHDRQKELPTTVKSGLMNVLSAPPTIAVPQTVLGDSTAVRELMEGYLRGGDTPLKNVLAPQFMTIAPPLLPVDDELIWMDQTNPAWHKPIYDTTVTNVSAEAKRLISLVFNEALNIQDRQVLLAELESDPNMVYHIGLTPKKLPDLVENNPLVAIEILLKLMHSTQITEYLNVLVNMEMSLYSMEVVNRLVFILRLNLLLFT